MSGFTLLEDIPLGLDWKNSVVTYTMLLTGLMDGSSAESSVDTALENRSLIASRGNGRYLGRPFKRGIASTIIGVYNLPRIAGAGENVVDIVLLLG